MTLETLIQSSGLTVEAEFVPFSRSRNKAEKQPSLNWLVTVSRNGRKILSTDYMAGCAHAPAYSAKFPGIYPAIRQKAVAQECETGKRISRFSAALDLFHSSGETIKPDAKDVIYSLMVDASAIDAQSFSDWCAEFGYSDDSIKARKTYDECMAHAVAMRAALGAETFEAMREAASQE